MSFPEELQEAVQALYAAIDRSSGLGLTMVQVSVKPGVQQVRVLVSINDKYQSTWDTEQVYPQRLAAALRDSIRQHIQRREREYEAVQKQVKDGQAALDEIEASLKQMRDLTPTSLIALAKCVDDEPSLKKEDLDWIDGIEEDERQELGLTSDDDSYPDDLPF